MIRFIVCEDDQFFLDRVCNSINKVMMSYSFDYKIHKFNEYSRELCDIINLQCDEKIYVLDIELPKISGLEIASSIRENDIDSKIIFLTAHNECRNDVFYSRLIVVDYIQKSSLWTGRFEETVKKIVSIMNKDKVLFFDFRCSSYRILLNDIVYIEKIPEHQKCLIHTILGENYEITLNLSDLEERLGNSFFRSHKTCIVNIRNIKKINYSSGFITFSNNECIYALAIRNKKELKERIAELNCKVIDEKEVLKDRL